MTVKNSRERYVKAFHRKEETLIKIEKLFDRIEKVFFATPFGSRINIVSEYEVLLGKLEELLKSYNEICKTKEKQNENNKN